MTDLSFPLQLIQEIQVDGVLKISKEFAKRCFKRQTDMERLSGVSVGADGAGSNIKMWARMQLGSHSAQCRFFMTLDKASALPFKLQDVIDWVA